MVTTHGTKALWNKCACVVCTNAKRKAEASEADSASARRRAKDLDAARKRNARARDPKQRASCGRVVAFPNSKTGQSQPPQTPTPLPEPGTNELAVIEFFDSLDDSPKTKLLAMQARTQARILDDHNLSPMHPQANRQLSQLVVQADPTPKKKSKGRLAAVQAMTGRRRVAQ